MKIFITLVGALNLIFLCFNAYAITITCPPYDVAEHYKSENKKEFPHRGVTWSLSEVDGWDSYSNWAAMSIGTTFDGKKYAVLCFAGTGKVNVSARSYINCKIDGNPPSKTTYYPPKTTVTCDVNVE